MTDKFWTIEKLQLRIQELKEWRYKDVIDLEEWTFAVDPEERVGAYPPPDLQPERLLGRGDRWRGRGTYVWLGKRVDIPAEWTTSAIVGLFDFGHTGGGTNMGFESLLFVDGKPYQGVDMNHREVFFPGHMAGRQAELVFRMWSGLEGGGPPEEQEHQFRQAALALLDERIDNLYYTAKAVLDSAKLMEEDRLERHRLLQALDRAFLLLDWSRPGSEAFYQSAYKADAALEAGLAPLAEEHPVTMHCVGHTHIDVAWLWRLRHTREKIARSFSTVLRLMEKYPEYIFMQTQPQLYAYLKEDYPEIYEQIKKRVAEGRWEAGGGMWLEADCNLTSGESLVRQLLYGTRFLREEFGVECEYLWLPDVFGYSWALPQILRKSGIRTFMTTKISWNQYNRMPHDTFMWRGIDGSEVLTHFITTPDVPDSTVWWYMYNGYTEPFAVKGAWDAYRDKGINHELLLTYGHGDGGGGVNRDMLETRRRLERMPGIPQAVPGRADDFFRGLHERIAATDQYVATWDGELYLEYHRGTYTSQAYVKRMNRKLELLLRDAEWLHSLKAAAGGDWSAYPSGKLKESWITVLRNQFHDIIPGSSIAEVYEDARQEYEATAATVGVLLRDDGRGKKQPEEPGLAREQVFAVYNSTAFARYDLAMIPVSSVGSAGVWFDASGVEQQAQRCGDMWLVKQRGLPGMSASELSFHSDCPGSDAGAVSPFRFSDGVMITPHYHASFNEAGQLTSLYDLEFGREVLADGALGNELQVFEDKPKSFDAWDIDLFYTQKMQVIRELVRLELTDCGSLRATLRLEWKYGDSSLCQLIHFYADSRRIDFETTVDWKERQQLLKVAFPVKVRAVEATYDIQFGNVKRPTHWNTSWDYARFETVGHQWADLSERGYGTALLNDCKYGYDIKDHVMRLTLIKSAIYPDPHADQGEHSFTYALLPHGGDWLEGHVAEEAWMLNNPLLPVEGAPVTTGLSLLHVSADRVRVAVDAVKKAEDVDAAVIRLHEYSGASGKVVLQSDFAIVEWQECDLMERPLGEAWMQGPIALELAPYEIKTLLIRFGRQH